MENILIDLQENSYPIYIEQNLLNSIDSLLSDADKYFIITDENIYTLYSNRLLSSFKEKDIYHYILKPGERSKSFSNLENILDSMVEKGLTRNSKIIAFGGGVVGDIAGFCASIYMRGVNFVQIPTTLLAQVDSSVGGKTAINMPGGKNMIGSFYQPEAVFIDTSTLNSLANKEIISGIGEILKYGIIWDFDFLNYLDKNLDKLINLEEDITKYVIKKCCTIKAKIVSKDEKETGIRKILNFGHTLAHSLETITDYKRYTHGEAVLVGMYYESLMACSMGLIDSCYFAKIESIILRLNIDLDISEFPLDSLVQIMMIDKKNRDNKISFILPQSEGIVKEILLDKEEIIWQTADLL